MNRSVTIAIVIVVVAIIAGGAYAAIVTTAPKTTSTTTTTQSSTSSSSTTSSTTSSSASSSSSSSSSSVVSTTSTTTSTTSSSSSSTTAPLSCANGTVTIGYFANVNHGPALIGLGNSSSGISFQSVLGPSCTIKTVLFSSGPPEMLALLANEIQIAYVGPDPAVSAYINDNQALQIVSGAASGGALFVVTNQSGITNINATGGIATLNGGTFAAPSLGNTQDVALETYLNIHHVNGTTIKFASDSSLVTEITDNGIDGAWLPQPYASLALADANANGEKGAHIFLNEQQLWPGGNFSTAEMVVSTSYLSAHADVVQKLVLANVEEIQWMNQNPVQAALAINASIFQLSGTYLSSAVLNQSISTLSFTYNPLITSVQQQAQNAYALGFLGSTEPDLTGLFNLTYLNNALTQLGLPTVSS